MKIQFNPDLDYQLEAIAAVTDLFKGQEICRTNFTVMGASSAAQTSLTETALGIGNRLQLLDDELLENLHAVQLRNGLPPSADLESKDFTVEMETGTGKTYVYLRSIFELNRLYGFTKFIIVVPSVAIKEGVHKSLQITEEHFQGLYDNVRFDYFVYDSQKLGQVRNFATSDCIQIMVINIDAFRKSFTDPQKESKANIIHRAHDRMAGARPIEFIQATRPIVIIDEPQSVANTPKSKEAIASLHPLCTFRYSATHRERHNPIYRLDAVDAYERKLVKQIEVAGIEVENSHNRAYIRLIKVDNKKGPVSAQVEIDVAGRTGKIARRKRTVRPGDDLFELSGNRSVYDAYIVEDISCAPGQEYISFTSRPEVVRLGQSIGEVDHDAYKRLQIRKTIEEHLDKELRLRPRGIKVLSLFFIDRVANYRQYDDDGNPQPGKYALMFEEEYRRAIGLARYADLFKSVDVETEVAHVHNGYFAIDRKKDTRGEGRFKDSRGRGTTIADGNAYQLIMRDKERLLSFDSKLKFIFSHSALREGWDNPNVFQICTLNETTSEMKKRQELGRGLRIAVNQAGERVYGFEVNTLTVLANESYEEYARKLQKEFEEETGLRFGVVEKHTFANIAVLTEEDTTTVLGHDASTKIWSHLKAESYIDNNGKIQDSLRRHLVSGEVSLPEAQAEQAVPILAILKKIAGNLNIRNADKKKAVRLNKAVYLSEEFRQLWERIKHRTTYQVDFDPDKLIEACIREIKRSLKVGSSRYKYHKSQAEISRGGVQVSEAVTQTLEHEARNFALPDIVSYLQNETNLTRRSIVEILRRCERLDDFKRNPQSFIEQVLAIIKLQMNVFIVDGIKYERIGDEHCYTQELFENNELYGYLSKNMLESEKSLYHHVIYDSDTEARFARSLENSNDVRLYAKLPGWFKIETPLGAYNPDWAVVLERDGRERLYFVVETKGTPLLGALRPEEQARITCGKAHFKALGTDVEFKDAPDFESFERTVG